MNDSIDAKITQIASALGPWRVADRSCQRVWLEHDDGHEIMMEYRKGRLEIRGCYPALPTGGSSLPYGMKRATISVGAERPTPEIVREIQRRLLPAYNRQYAEALANLTDAAAYENATKTSLERLAKIAELEIFESGTRKRCLWYGPDGAATRYIEVEVSAARASLRIDTTVDRAEELLRAATRQDTTE